MAMGIVTPRLTDGELIDALLVVVALVLRAAARPLRGLSRATRRVEQGGTG